MSVALSNRGAGGGHDFAIVNMEEGVLVSNSHVEGVPGEGKSPPLPKHDELSWLRARVADLEAKLGEKMTGETGEQGDFNRKRLLDFAAFAVESLSDGVFLIAKDAHMIYVNRAACDQLGYSERQLLDMTILDINPTLTMESWNAIWGVTVSDKIQVIETVHRTRDGREFPVEVLANFIELDGKQYSCSFTRDITSRKEMEMRLRQGEKMEAIGQLAGGIAHDFNNQLSAILGYAGLLKLELPGDRRIQKYIDGIIKASERSAGLTTQLLAFSRQGKYLSVTVDMHSLIDETVEMLKRSINKNITIVEDFRASIATTTGDPALLENALLNIAINARDAMPSGGVLRFSTRIVELDASYHSEYNFDPLPGEYIKIGIADTGSGMAPDVLKKIFEPFFTTKEQGKGTGMGLASVYGTIKSHRGGIDVRSRVGEGSEFILYLPFTKAKEIEHGDAGSRTVAPLRSAKVLVVDDEPLVLSATERNLEYLGYRIITADSGEKALNIYKESFKEIDAVLLDLIMPGLSGKETFIRMRSVNPLVTAIIASGYGMEGEVQGLLDEGVLGFVNKPFDFKELSAMLSRIIAARK
jgi:two-component system, cell cycle sensor histidine kinase and response regulator CckA